MMFKLTPYKEVMKILEAKQVGIVYHFTTLKALKNLLKGKDSKGLKCELFGFGSYNHHFSTTRNFNLTSDFIDNDFINKDYIIRIAFDGNKISNDYKVKPIAGLYDNDKQPFGTSKNDNRVPRNSGEAEEIICPKVLQGEAQVFWLKKYIKEVSIQQTSSSKKEQEDFKELQKIMDKNNIKSNITRKFTPLNEIEYSLDEKSLQESFILEAKTSGTYVAVKWDENTGKDLRKYFYDIPNLVPKDDFHTTLVYSKVCFNHTPIKENFKANFKGFKIFESQDGNQVLVIELESKQLTDRHKEIYKNNPKATYDYDEYIPHITLSYDVSDMKKEDLDRILSKEYIDYIKNEQFESFGGGIEYTKPIDDSWV